jgi:hypothetical protein
MPPLSGDYAWDLVAPFEESMIPMTRFEGQWLYPLCSIPDAAEAYRRDHGPTGFGDRGGWELFAAAPQSADGFLIDPGTPDQHIIAGDDLAALVALSEAVAVERAWERLRKGDELPDDLEAVARYGSYHLGVARRNDDEYCFCEVPNDDGRMFVALFTHEDALTQGWTELAERYAGLDPRQASVSGPEIFPTLATEPTTGMVLNFAGPPAVAVFTREVFDLLIDEIDRI